MATVLGLFNGALLLCRNAALATTSDGGPANSALGTVYAGAVQYCLEQALWTHARTNTTITGTTAGTSSISMGYPYEYEKPSDLIRLASISASSNFYPPLEHFEEDQEAWYSSEPTAYITYTSNSTSWGNNLAAWPETFGKMVEAYLAFQIYPQIATAGPEEISRVKMEYDRRLAASMAKDAQNQFSRVTDPSREAVYQGAMRLLGFRPLLRGTDESIYKRLHSMMPTSQNDAGDSGAFAAHSDMLDEFTLRTMLDEVWLIALSWVIEQGLWNWGQRSIALMADTAVEPSFGYSWAFQIPTDFVRLCSIAGNDLFYPQCDDYILESGYISASFNPLYIVYVSNDPNYGMNIGTWPRTVLKALEAYLAVEVAPYLGNRINAQRLVMLRTHLTNSMRDARSKNALNAPPGKENPGRLFASRTVWRGNAWRERR